MTEIIRCRNEWLENLAKERCKVVRLRDKRYTIHPFAATLPLVPQIFEESFKEIDKLDIIKWYVTKHSKSAKFLFGWNPKFDDPEATDFSKMLKTVTIIRLL